MNNGYTTVEIDGKIVGIKFGMPAIRYLVEKSAQIELVMKDTYTDEGLAHILFAGYKNHCIAKDVVPEYEFQMFYDWVDQAVEHPERIEKVASVVRLFEESRYVKAAEKNIEDQSKKKDGHGMKLNDSVMVS